MNLLIFFNDEINMRIVKCCDREIELEMEGTQHSEIAFCYYELDVEHEFNQSMYDHSKEGWEMDIIVSVAERFIRLSSEVIASSNDRDEYMIKKIFNFRRKVEDLIED